jgi:uncharacterized protein YecT (DUF1311 family)
MRHGRLLPALLLALSGLALAATPPRPTPSHKPPRHPATAPADETIMSTADLLKQSADDLERADKEMNRVYQRLLAMLDNEGKEKLRLAQRAWLKFRDAQASFDADVFRGGSAAGILDLGARLELTTSRTQSLEGAIEARR